jgi:hypothetical protein
MTPKTSVTSPYGIKELQEQIALLRWITAKIDRLATDAANITNPEDLNDLLEWIALFTREHFGFEQRLLRLLEDYSHYGRYLAKRAAVHSSFRIQLTQLWIDKMRDDPYVSERLRSLCHELLEDAQAHDKIVAIVMQRNGAPPLRTRPRRGQVAVETAPLGEADILALAGTPHS